MSKVVKLHKFQSQAIRASLEEGIPFVAMIAGVQSGKTTGGAVWEVAQWAKNPDKDHLICAPTYKTLQQSTLRKLDMIRPEGWAHFNKSDSYYTLCGGGKVWCRSTEDPDGIEGITAYSVWADEAGKMPIKANENMQARRSATRGPMMYTTTPYGTNWLKTDIFDNAAAGKPEYRVVHWRSCDSPYFDWNEYQRAKRDMNPVAFARKYGGQFQKLEGVIYPDFDQNRHVADWDAIMREAGAAGATKIPADWDIIGGIDWGYSDGHPFAASIWASPDFRDQRSKVVKVWERKVSGKLIRDHVAAMKAAQHSIGMVSRWYADPSAAQEIAECRELGLKNIRSAINKVEWGIDQVTTLIRRDRMRLVRGKTTQTVDEFETYHRDESEKIVKENDHLVDADRYALATHTKRGGVVEIL